MKLNYLLTYLVPARFRPANKSVVAFLGAVAGFVAYAYADQSWAGAVVGIATALGVYHVPNESNEG